MAFESLLSYARLFGDAPSKADESTVRSAGLPIAGRAGDVYSEEAFRHFLALERLRAERSERVFLLLLVHRRPEPRQSVHFSASEAETLLQVLKLCVREVDFVGWYRDRRVAGAVLAQGLDEPDHDAANRILQRVNRVLAGRLSKSMSRRLRARVVRLRSAPK